MVGSREGDGDETRRPTTVRRPARWWNPFAPQRGEPRGQSRIIVRATLASIGLVAIANLVSTVGYKKAEPFLKDCPSCVAQADTHERRKADNDHAVAVTRARVAVLAAEMEDPTSGRFAHAPELLASEKARLHELENAQTHLETPVSISETWGLIALMLVSTAVVALAGRLFLRHAAKVIPRRRRRVALRSPRWRRFLTLVTLPSWGYFVLRNVITSIFLDDKASFGLTSFCVSHVGFVLSMLAGLPFLVALSAPVATALCLSNPSIRPAVRIAEPTRVRAIARYVLFLQTWTILALAVTTAIAVPSIHFALATTSPTESRIETILDVTTGIGGLLAVIVLMGRFVQTAATVRLAHQEQVARWTIKARPPKDPTIDFLGERWWSLPSVLVGMIGVVWTALELSGLAGRLVALAK
jgi:hypothetical protein